MSSIKQVQDLERQLQEAKQELERVRSSEQKLDSPETDQSSPSLLLPELPLSSQHSRRMARVRIPQNLGNARTNILDIGRGLLKPPLISVDLNAQEKTRLTLPDLPPFAAAEKLLQGYYECVHQQYPVLSWPDFQRDFVHLYQAKSSTDLPRETIAVIFAVLACGAQHFRPPTYNEHGQKLLSMAISLIDMWEEDLSTTQILVVFLASLFLAEANRKSASWIWLGSAIRIAQDLGLHIQDEQWTTADAEMRKCIWWSLYNWDRIMATEMSKPMLINDEDCGTDYPEIAEEQQLLPFSDFRGPNPLTLLLTILPVARLLSPLAKVLKSDSVSIETLNKFDAHLEDCMSTFPPQLQLGSDTLISPMLIQPLVCFQNTRLVLHRHNLSPTCNQEQRLHAIQQCAAVACDTAQIITRCLPLQERDEQWRQNFVASANMFLCTHLWRCMLFLAFTRRYEPFFTLLQASSLIGDAKAINVACGRYLRFFLQQLIERCTKDGGSELEIDEELIVYLSGDLQSGMNSWVWNNTGSREQSAGRSTRTPNRERNREAEQGSKIGIPWASSLSDDELQSLGDWSSIEQAAQYLRHLQRAAPGPAEVMSQRQEADRPTSSDLKATDYSSRSRMNIANII